MFSFSAARFTAEQLDQKLAPSVISAPAFSRMDSDMTESTAEAVEGLLDADCDEIDFLPNFSRRSSSASYASSSASEGPSTPSTSLSRSEYEIHEPLDTAKVSKTGQVPHKSHNSLIESHQNNRIHSPHPLQLAQKTRLSATTPKFNSVALTMAPIRSITPKPSLVRRPTREEEEGSRSRSRFPRLLWSSTLDEPSLEVLHNFHVRTQGRPLPQLDRSRGDDGIKAFSRDLERAGL